MTYSYSICYPDNENIEYPKEVLDANGVRDKALNYSWNQQLDLLNSMAFEKVSYNPSLDFTNKKDKHSFCLTAEGTSEGYSFSVWYARPVVKKTWFGLSEKEVMDVVDKKFSKEDAYRLLNEFLQQNYDLLEKAIK